MIRVARWGVPVCLIIFAIWWALGPYPTYNQTKLKAIKAESEILAATHPIKAPDYWVKIPKNQWPPVIASLQPEAVSVNRWGVDIVIKSYFDGGWGYGIARRKQDLPMLQECWSEESEGVFWHGPC